MPNVENLRKQAKRIVRWHREGHHPVAALIRTHLSAFKDLSDLDILAHQFRLTDAQEIIAQQQGFLTWQALLQGVTQMPESKPKSAAIKRAEPQLFVTNLSASLAFFNEKLGFATQFAYGDPPFYAQVARDGVSLNLRLVDQPLINPELAEGEGYLSATLCVEGVKELFLEYQAASVPFHHSLRTEPWGARTFCVLAPDGNLILFAE